MKYKKIDYAKNHIIFFSLITIAQEKDYTLYHKDINKAEELFFLKNDIDSTLYYYDKVFESYDFKLLSGFWWYR